MHRSILRAGCSKRVSQSRGLSSSDPEHGADQAPSAVICHTKQMALLIGNELAKRSFPACRDIEIVEHYLGPGRLPSTRRDQLENYPISCAASRRHAVEITRPIGDEPALGKCSVSAFEVVNDRLRPGGLSRRWWREPERGPAT